MIIVNKIYQETSIKIYDVLFIGHFSKDRLNIINYLLENNIKVKIFGPGWNVGPLSKQYCYDKPILPIYGDDYFRAIKQSKICLAFLSKLNRDVYTRRNFEITAMGTLMLSERTKELTNKFKKKTE